jgi:hypothetical protein
MGKNVTFVTILLDSFTVRWLDEAEILGAASLSPQLPHHCLDVRILQENHQQEQGNGHGQNNEPVCHRGVQDVCEFFWHRSESVKIFVHLLCKLSTNYITT